MRSVSDAVSGAIGAASRSVARGGLEREIANLKGKIRAKKQHFGLEAYAHLDAGDRAQLNALFSAACDDIADLAAAVARKQAALDALRVAAEPLSPRRRSAPQPPAPGSSSRDLRLAAELGRREQRLV